LINCPVAGLTVAIAISVPPPKSFGAILIFNLMESEVCEGEKEKTIIEGRWGRGRRRCVWKDWQLFEGGGVELIAKKCVTGMGITNE